MNPSAAWKRRVEPFEPRRRLEPLERLACLGEQRLRLAGPTLPGEPLAVLELRDGKVELRRDFPEQPGRALEPAIGFLRLDTHGREAGAEARRLGLEILRRAAWRNRLDDRQHLLGLLEIVERERGLERDHEQLLDVLRVEPYDVVKSEPFPGERERFRRAAGREHQQRLAARIGAALLSVRGHRELGQLVDELLGLLNLPAMNLNGDSRAEHRREGDPG